MPIDPGDLTETVTRQRQTNHTTPEGGNTQDWTTIPTQSIRATIQPNRGLLNGTPDGLLSKATDKMFCNFYSGASPLTSPTDIAVGDRIQDAKGIYYRAEFVFDDGGAGDHLLIGLQSLGTNGE